MKLETRPAKIRWWTLGKLTGHKAGAGEKAQWLRALAPLVVDLGSVLSIHVRQLTAARNSTSRDLTLLSTDTKLMHMCPSFSICEIKYAHLDIP